MTETDKLKIEKPFENGVHSVLKVEWQLKLETPLCIKNGHSFAWQSVGDDSKKSRNHDTVYKWNTPKSKNERDNENEIQDLHYGLFVEDGKLVPKYMVPASSIRGTLRSWTIQHLVNRFLWDDEWRELNPESNTDNLPNLLKPDIESGKIKLSDVRKAVINEKNGFALVAGLFGMTLENLDDGENYAHAGRLKMETMPFNSTAILPSMDTTWKNNKNTNGPDNAARQITWRGPVDRITHSAKDGGLHTFLEFSSGQSFVTNFRILNPGKTDLALFALWKREINNGYLRLGGLTSIGRGRVHVTEQKMTFYSIQSQPVEDTPYLSPNTNADWADGSIWNIYPVKNIDSLIPHLATILGKGEQ